MKPTSSIFAAVALAFASVALATPAWCSLPVDEAQRILSVFEQETVGPVAQAFGAKFEYLFNTEIQIPQAVVASSAERDGDDWMVSVLVASVYHPKLTSDAFILLVCHELGHHFGGAPWKNDDHGKPRWASVEGQADYYATAVCGKRMFGLIPPDPSQPRDYPREIRSLCARHVRDRKGADLCARSIVASQSLVEALAEKFYPWNATDRLVVDHPHGIEPDPKDGHYEYPSYDCRMETLRRGALCQRVPNPTNDDLLGRSGNERNCSGPADGRPSCWW